jgi:signal transduction histidine kinase
MRRFLRLNVGRAGAGREEIRAAQVNALFRQMPIAIGVNAVNAVITAVVLQQLASTGPPLVWLAATLLVTAGRWALWLHYRRRGRDAAGTGCGSLLAGLCWGLGGALLFPAAPRLGQLFLTLVIGGMCTGAVVINASHLPSLLAFLLSASLPMAGRFFFEGTITATAVGVMTLVFAAALSAAGVQLNRFFTETMRLRFELGAANRRLGAEIVEREATEAALRQAQKLEAIGQLTGGISHDFNNILTLIIGNLTLAIGRAGDVPAILPSLRNALQAAERGAALVQRLLGFARKQQLDPKSVDLRRLVANMADMLRRTLGNRVRVAITADPDLAPALVDANQLELAILNLTINARDAMPEGGMLRIGLQNWESGRDAAVELPEGAYVVLSVSDTGTGMDEATLAQACEPFFTTKDIGSGSGLGLSMVKGFAVQSGGDVRIRSEPGEGTTVELWLPRAAEPTGPGA